MDAQTFDEYVDHLRGSSHGTNLVGLSRNGVEPTDAEFYIMARTLYLFGWGHNKNPQHPDDFRSAK